MKKYYIYKMKNLVNHKIYIALSTKNLEEFIWLQNVQVTNLQSNRGNHVQIVHAIAEYGIDNFEIVEVASVLDRKIAHNLKKVFINKYQSNDDEYGYNKTTRRSKKVTDAG